MRILLFESVVMMSQPFMLLAQLVRDERHIVGNLDWFQTKEKQVNLKNILLKNFKKLRSNYMHW